MTGPDYITFAAKRIQKAFAACDSDLAALDQIKAGVAEYERKIAAT